MGSFDLATFVDTDPDSWDRYVRINYYGVLNCVHVALPAMIDAGWGRIITIISDAGRAGDQRTAVYAGAKAATAGSCGPSLVKSGAADHRELHLARVDGEPSR